MADVNIFTGRDPRVSGALKRITKLEEQQMALVDDFRARAEKLDTLEASVREAFTVVRERLSALEASNADAETMKAELASIGSEMDQSLGEIGGIVTANTTPPTPDAEPPTPEPPQP